MQDKNILILCKEASSYPQAFLIDNLLKKENKIAVYFFMAPESMYSPCELNKSTYYYFKSRKDVIVYDFNEYAMKIEKESSILGPDLKYLEYIENNYCTYKNLNLQLMSSQFTTRMYHYRNFISLSTNKQNLLFIEYYYKNAFEIINEFKPDVIIDYDDAELARTVVNEIAFKKNIPYITIDHPRFENYKIPTYNLGVKIGSEFKRIYSQKFALTEQLLTDEFEYIRKYRTKTAIMPDEYKGTITSTYSSPPLRKSIRSLLYMTKYFFLQDLTKSNWKIKRKSKFLYPNSFEYLKFYFRVEKVKRVLYKKNKYFHNPISGENYIYMPLHLIPESTTFVKSPFYVNELFIIETISKSLPIGWYLYVKEHQAMLGERGVDFYDKVNSFPNVKMVQFNYYSDPKPWIENSMGVVTITGTSAFEAALLGKPAIIFGDPTHSIIDSITRNKSFEDLPQNLMKFKDYSETANNMKSTAAYIAAVKEYGLSLKYKYLMSEGERLVKNNLKPSVEFLDEILILENFYDRAYTNFKNENNNKKKIGDDK